MMLELECGAETAARVILGMVEAGPVVVGPASAELEGLIADTCTRLGRKYAGCQPGQIPELQPARKLYRAFGVDPTRTRPSSEALLRRVLRQKPFPRINNAVDLGNLLALRFWLSLGLYDAEKIAGRVVLRTGRPGESYSGVAKEQVNLAGRLVLADEQGPFGNPSADSARTAVDEHTRHLVMVLFAPGDYSRHRLESHLSECRQLMPRHLAGTEPVVVNTSIRAS